MFSEAIRWGSEIFWKLREILRDKKYATAVGDEGGFAPNLKSNEEACELIEKAIKAAGYSPGQDVCLALDAAASSFCSKKGRVYNLRRSQQGRKSSSEMTALYKSWTEEFPIVLIEDGLAENDWEGFRELTAILGEKIQIVGDDLYVTNTERIKKGIKEKATKCSANKVEPNWYGDGDC